MRLILIVALLLLTACQSARPAAPEAEIPPWQRASVTRKIDEPEDDAAELVPADARWYARIDGLADWLDERQGDPLVNHLWKVIRSYQPPQLWKRGGERLGVTDRELILTYFGRTLAVVDQKIGDVHGVVVMTRADESALRALPQALSLSPAGEQDRIGPFSLYIALDGEKEYTFAIGRRWLMVTETKYIDHLRRLMTAVAAGQRPLSRNRHFNALLRQLPRDHDARVLVRDSDGDDHHALTLTRDGQALTADYMAEAPRLHSYIKDVQEVRGVEFGPMPDSVVLALSVNVLHRSVPGAALLNMLLFPQNFKDRVRPSIAPPIILFLGSLSPERVEPDPGVAVPVVGVAVRLTNPAVADDLDRMVRGVHFLLSASRLDLASGLFGVRRVKRDGLEYQVADFGPAIQRRVGDASIRRLTNLPSSAGLTKLTFGRIGDYYVICSQEAFFRDWHEAEQEPSRRLTSAPGFDDFRLEERPRLLASFLLRAPELGELLHQVADYWRIAQPKPQPPAVAMPTPIRSREPKPDTIEQPLRWIADGLRYRQSFSVQLWRDRGKHLYGRLRVVPPTEPSSERATTQQ